MQDDRDTVEQGAVPSSDDLLITSYHFTYAIFSDEYGGPTWSLSVSYTEPSSGTPSGKLITNLDLATVTELRHQLQHHTAYFNSGIPNNGGLRFIKK